MKLYTKTIPYDYVQSTTKLSWREILYGIDAGFLNSCAAIKHAENEFKNTDNFSDALLSLTWQTSGDNIQPYLNELVNAEGIQDEEKIKNKWLYLILLWIYENKDKYKDALQIAEYIYADFDYPDIIESFVKYMPPANFILTNKEKNLDKLYSNWHQFLMDNKNMIS